LKLGKRHFSSYFREGCFGVRSAHALGSMLISGNPLGLKIGSLIPILSWFS
jgi:hypothetical protein